MGSEFKQTFWHKYIFNMKTFVAVSCLLAVALADQSSHQAIKLGNAPSVSHSVHKPHGAYHATVASQPHAAPQDVHAYLNKEKYTAAVHAPAHIPVHAPAYAPAPYHPAPVYPPAPVVHKPVAVVHKPVVPVHPAPAPYHPAPAPYHPAPVHKPAPYHEPAYDAPATYAYEYGVADEHSGANFAQNEGRDGYATHGEYRVALPDGRPQIVSYNVADAYSGYVADVRYEGEAHYNPAPAYKPAPKPAYHA